MYLTAKADVLTAKNCVDDKNKFVRLQAAYHIQQAVEKTIKFLLFNTLEPEKWARIWGHDITKLVFMAQSAGLSVPSDIDKNAERLASWEADTRYGKPVIIRKDTMIKMISIVDVWHHEIDKQIRAGLFKR